MEPAYLKTYRDGVLAERVEMALALLESCEICPRGCGVNRLQGERGYCNTGRKARVASYNAHFGEESPLVGRCGSGTIFLSSCNLLCLFCQNYDISHTGEGVDVEPEHMAAMMIQSEQADMVVAGGVESMSSAEFYLPGEIKWGIGGKGGMPRGHGDLSIWGLRFYDRIQRARVMSQPEERYGVLPAMMSWAETAAEEEGITREVCDRWSLESHQKACAAIEAGKFAEEIVPVQVPQRKGEALIVDRDENPRADTSIEKLAQLKPVMVTLLSLSLSRARVAVPVSPATYSSSVNSSTSRSPSSSALNSPSGGSSSGGVDALPVQPTRAANPATIATSIALFIALSTR